MHCDDVSSHRRFRRRVAALALAAALGTSAAAPMAAIVDSGPIAIAVPAALDGIYMDSVTGASATAAPFPAGWDFNPYATGNGTTLDFFTSTTAANANQIVGNLNVAAALSPGATIGPASNYATAGVVSTRNTPFQTTATSYVGVRFMNEVTGVLNYGYAQVQTTAPLGFPATVLRVIYENAGAAITIPGGGGSPPVFQSAVSRRVHGVAGTYDLPLTTVMPPSINHNPTTEPRQGPTQSIVFSFDRPLTGAAAAVSEGVAVVSLPIVVSGDTVTVSLTGVTDGQYVTVDLTNVSDTLGGGGGSASVRLGFLAGDVNQTRAVTIGDLGLINAQVAQTVSTANYLLDVNASGTLTLADKGIANATLTHALPAP